MTGLLPLASTDLLADLSVVELSTRVGGAYCGKIFTQLGASVSRFGPPTDAIVSAKARPAMRQFLHDTKRDFGADDAALTDALATTDLIIIENDADDAWVREQARAIAANVAGLKPNAQILKISADGSGGAGSGLYSSAMAAMSYAIGSPGRAPLGLPYDVADYELGVSAAAAALAGLLRPSVGKVRSSDVAGRDGLAYFVGQLVPNYLPYGRPWRREGRRPSMSGGVYPCGLFPCKDGMVAIYCRSDREWHGVVRAMGDPQWSKEARFQDPKLVAREYADEADGHLFPWLADRTRAELTALGHEFDFPIAPMREVGEVLHDEQFSFRGSLAPLAADQDLVVPVAPWRLQTVADEAGSKPAVSRASNVSGGILEGIRVLDFSWVWSGPMVTSILTDLGAEVIKIEHSSRLDSLRLRGRPSGLAVGSGGPDIEVNPWFNQLNHGKLSATIDIKGVEGQRQARALAQHCDIVVENMRPGALDKLGLGYDALAKVNPSIVMLSMSMAGQTGPLRHSKGYAGIMSALAGLESLVGYGRSARGDIRDIVGMTMTALGDPNAAMHALSVLFAALARRGRTGKGVWIDLAQTDAVLAIMGAPMLEAQVNSSVPIYGNRHPWHVPHGHFACSGEDRWLALSVCDEATWQRLVAVSQGGLSPFAALHEAGRRARVESIEGAVATWLGTMERDDALRLLQSAAITAAPVATYDEMNASDWKRERGLTTRIRHPWLGDQDIFLPPWHFDGKVPASLSPAPLLGADTDFVLDMIS